MGNEEMPYVGNNNDFIILKLASTLTFNDDVGAACLPDADHAPDATGQTCFVSGWGTLESGGSSPSTLQWVAVPTVTNEKCSEAYSGITDSMICAGFPEGEKDSCQGDSGGPFICEDNGKAVLTGVVSFGIGCALPNTPGVYARTTAVLDWVKANMGGDAPAPPPPGSTTVAPAQGCPSNYVGDNYCDDECNNEEYNFDGGDCCFGDDYCDDENNNAECGFDGGDCCGDDVNTSYCKECECLEFPAETTQAPGICGSPQWFGDNYCDDDNNNAGCGFDGGDCCGDINTTYCSECLCLE